VAAKILVLGNTNEKHVSTSTKEVLGIRRKLSDNLAGELVGIFIGNQAIENVKEAISFGADKVIVVENVELGNYHPELYLAVMEKLCKAIDPDMLLMSCDFVAADLAPRIATRLGGVLTTDCVDLAIDSETKKLLCTKPIYGGIALAVYSSESRPQMATIRENVFSFSAPNEMRKGEMTTFDAEIDFDKKKIMLIERIKEDIPGIKLEKAEAIVCGGRGMGSSEAFRQLEELAQVLGGAVAGTRPTCEKGWLSPRLQVGLTGKKVFPKLYIAVGVSGAIQHMAGVGSKCIVAINKDPGANIFKEAHYGAVGDYKDILPAFKEKIKEILEKRRAQD